RLATVALAYSCAIEVSQLYHAPWIDAIRRTLPGALVLGYGFLWSDLVCYAAGVALGAGGESAVRRASARPPVAPAPSRRTPTVGRRCDKLFAWVPPRRSSSPACPARSTRPGPSPDRRASPTAPWSWRRWPTARHG